MLNKIKTLASRSKKDQFMKKLDFFKNNEDKHVFFNTNRIERGQNTQM